MSLDIHSILENWPYRPDELTVRLVEGDDGREKIQLRLDLGVMQMEIDGRPDGRRIHDTDSWLSYHQERQKEHDTAHPDAAPYSLEPEDCVELLREGVQYYHRYLSFWHLGRYELCARDTERNLRLFAFVREHARSERDKLQFDQWRPYVTMMHTRAVATPLVDLEQWDAAVGVVDAGIRGIEQFLKDYDQMEQASRLSELAYLRRWKKEIINHAVSKGEMVPDDGEAEASGKAVPGEPLDPIDERRGQLDEAIRQERYEDAARLRDEIRRLEDPPPPGGWEQ